MAMHRRKEGHKGGSRSFIGAQNQFVRQEIPRFRIKCPLGESWSAMVRKKGRRGRSLTHGAEVAARQGGKRARPSGPWPVTRLDQSVGRERRGGTELGSRCLLGRNREERVFLFVFLHFQSLF